MYFSITAGKLKFSLTPALNSFFVYDIYITLIEISY